MHSCGLKPSSQGCLLHARRFCISGAILLGLLYALFVPSPSFCWRGHPANAESLRGRRTGAGGYAPTRVIPHYGSSQLRDYTPRQHSQEALSMSLGRELVRDILAKALAVVLACTIGFTSVTSAYAESDGAIEAEVETIEAALAVIGRSFYDQRLNGQDLESVRSKYLSRAKRGESAGKLVREMVVSLGDNYSRVVDRADFEKMTAYDPLGVGIVLNRRDSSEVVVGSPPFARSAAEQAGIRSGDVVLALDGRSMGSESMLSAMDRIARADPPTVTMSLRRKEAGGAESTDFDVTLRRTQTPTAAAAKLLDYGVVPATEGVGHRVGYLRLRSFGARSPLEIGSAIRELRAEGADEFVLDLRGNLGGSYQAALEVAAFFLEPQRVASHVQTKSSLDQPLGVLGDQNVPPAKEPLVVLVDGFSASASEVLAAALRGNCRAPLVGDRSYGKAALQSVFGLPSGEAIVLTVAKYSGPKYLKIEGGLQPDYRGASDPLASLGRFASTAGLMRASVPTAEYAAIDFGEPREASLRACVPELLP